jgi:hypothetical protein
LLAHLGASRSDTHCYFQSSESRGGVANTWQNWSEANNYG